jgi:hypothetical protein
VLFRCFFRVRAEKVDIRACRGKNAADQPVRLRDERIQQMRLRDFGIPAISGELLRGLNRLYAFLC